MDIIIGLYAILVLTGLGVAGYMIAHVIAEDIAENKDIQDIQKRIENNKAKYRGLLINSIKEFEEISRIKYPKYYYKYKEVASWDNTIDIKPQKITILKKVEDGLLLVKCVSGDTRCEFYVDVHGEIYLEDAITPIGSYEKIGEFTFEREKLL